MSLGFGWHSKSSHWLEEYHLAEYLPMNSVAGTASPVAFTRIKVSGTQEYGIAEGNLNRKRSSSA